MSGQWQYFITGWIVVFILVQLALSIVRKVKRRRLIRAQRQAHLPHLNPVGNLPAHLHNLHQFANNDNIEQALQAILKAQRKKTGHPLTNIFKDIPKDKVIKTRCRKKVIDKSAKN